MSDPVTAHLGLTLPIVGDPDGEDAWGEKVNENFEILDGYAATTLVDAPTTGGVYGRQLGAWVVIDAVTPEWTDIIGKPSTFPPTLPIAQADVIGLSTDLANKEPTILSGSVAHFWRGDKTWAPVPSSGGGGGPVDWTDIVNKPATFPPTTPIPQANVTNLVTDLTAKAPLASPALTGNPTAPTAPSATNSTALATTAYVKSQGYAPLTSPTFTGVPKAPTPASGDNSTLLATTAFVSLMLAGLPIGDLDCGTFPYAPVVPPDPPVPTDYPSASNTGPSGTLTASGPVSSSSDGQVIQNLDVTGSIIVSHTNVIVRNNRVTTTDPWGIDCDGATNSLVEDCEVITLSNGQGGIFLSSGTARRNEVRGFDNGIYFVSLNAAATITIEDNYIHGLGGGAEAHVDGIQTQACGPGATMIRHNTIMSWDTSHIFLQCTTGDLSNIKVLDNQLLKDPTHGAPGYNVYVNGWGTRPGGGAATISNVEVANNFGDRGLYGDIDVAGNTSGISVHDNSLGFVVEPPPATTGVTLYNGASPTGGSPTMDNNEMSLGVRVDPIVAGAIHAVLFWRASNDAATDGTVAIYNAAGTKLAEKTFTGLTGVGWKRIALDTPLAVNNTTAYVAAVWMKIGGDGHSWYWAEANKFSAAGITVSGKMTAPRSDGTMSRGAVQKNNTFVYTSGNVAFPDQVFPLVAGSGYYIDVDFV